MNRFPKANYFQEFPLTEKEIEQILFTMKSEFVYVIDAKRYEKANARYEERMSK